MNSTTNPFTKRYIGQYFLAQVTPRFLKFFSLIFLVNFSFATYAEKSKIPYNELKALSQAYYQIKANYVNEVDDKQLFEAAINGMLQSLDNHSRFLDKTNFEGFSQTTDGKYAGIGASFNDHKFGLEIIEVFDNSPAQRAGLVPKMIVTEIDDQSIQYVSAEQAFERLRGEEGSPIKLTIAASQFPKPKDFLLVREVIEIDSVDFEKFDNEQLYIKINSFTLRTLEEFQKIIRGFNSGQLPRSIIIDLRDNTGGVMETSLDLADLFISKGVLLKSRGRDKIATQTFNADSFAPYKDIPVAILINSNTASASEIFTAALKEHGKALTIGEKSYGKGSIQSIYRINRDSAVKITTAEYFTPNGDKIDTLGISPDIWIPNTGHVNSGHVNTDQTNTDQTNTDNTNNRQANNRSKRLPGNPVDFDHQRLNDAYIQAAIRALAKRVSI